MRRNIIFITGGARSGKSSFGLKLAEDRLKEIFGGESNSGATFIRPLKAYIATAQAFDEEIKERIERHKQERGKDWYTVEEPVDIVRALNELRDYPVILLDCLTLWISNLILNNLDIEKEIRRFLDAIKSSTFNLRWRGNSKPSACSSILLIVSNEVGMGIVPENELARRFRDVAGMVNQKVAEIADEVYFMVSGIPVKIKG
jgi:adenosylcobinamide kinase/adenosylcobinamide-phosphate guanylyltransferase